jgi:hypothetical protein
MYILIHKFHFISILFDLICSVKSVLRQQGSAISMINFNIAITSVEGVKYVAKMFHESVHLV